MAAHSPGDADDVQNAVLEEDEFLRQTPTEAVQLLHWEGHWRTANVTFTIWLLEVRL